MIQLTLKDGSIRELEAPTAAAEVIKGIGMGLYKAACCVKLDGEVCDLRTVIDHDCTFEVMTFDSEEGKKTFWHTASHVLAHQSSICIRRQSWQSVRRSTPVSIMILT